EALTAALRMSLGFVTAVARVNLGYALAMQGHLPEARSLETAAYESSKKRGGDRRLTCGALLYLSFAEHKAGALEAAEAHAREAVEISAPHPPVDAYSSAGLSPLQLPRGEKADPLARGERAMRIMRELGRLEAGEALVHLAYVEALTAAADTRRFGAIADAHDRLMARAALITDAEFRTNFLTRVEENVRILELSRSVGL